MKIYNETKVLELHQSKSCKSYSIITSYSIIPQGTGNRIGITSDEFAALNAVPVNQIKTTTGQTLNVYHLKK